MSLINEMSNAILNANVTDFGTVKKCLAVSYKNTDKELTHPLCVIADSIAEDDMKTITAGLELIKYYEDLGVQFELINYKTKK